MLKALMLSQRRSAIVVAAFLGFLVPGPATSGAAAPTTTMALPGVGFQIGEGFVSVSAGGRYIAFESTLSNLVPGDTNGTSDVFVKDTKTGTVERASVSSSGAQANGSSYGRPVDISSDGRYVLFASEATNLVAHDTNDFDDVFLRDRKLGTTVIVPHVTTFVFGEWLMSGNARWFAFGPPGHDNVVGLYDRVSGHLINKTIGNDEAGVTDLSDNGHKVLVLGTNGPRIWKPFSGRLIRIDQAVGGGRANARITPNAISGDGRLVMFTSAASNLVRGDTNGTRDVFVRNLVTHRTNRISVGNAHRRQANAASTGLGLSYDGRYRLFRSGASNLVAKDTNGVIDIFVRDLKRATIHRCSVSSTGAQANGRSPIAVISRNGRSVVFSSNATNLVPGDTDSTADTFQRGPGC